MTITEHLLETLSEECSEVIQAVCKAQRFAIDGRYPDGTLNSVKIVEELADVWGVFELLHERGILRQISQTAVDRKKVKVMQMMKIANERGALVGTPTEIEQIMALDTIAFASEIATEQP